MSLFNRSKGKLQDVSKRLKGCRQVINGIDLGEEYKKLYKEYSRLYDLHSIGPKIEEPEEVGG